MARINVYLVAFLAFEIVLSWMLRHEMQEQPKDKMLFPSSQLQ